MPTYSFRDKNTGEVETKLLSLAERQQYLDSNPHVEQLLAAPPIGDSVRLGVRKVDRSFNDVLIKAKEAHKHSTVQTHY